MGARGDAVVYVRTVTPFVSAVGHLIAMAETDPLQVSGEEGELAGNDVPEQQQQQQEEFNPFSQAGRSIH